MVGSMASIVVGKRSRECFENTRYQGFFWMRRNQRLYAGRMVCPRTFLEIQEGQTFPVLKRMLRGSTFNTDGVFLLSFKTFGWCVWSDVLYSRVGHVTLDSCAANSLTVFTLYKVLASVLGVLMQASFAILKPGWKVTSQWSRQKFSRRERLVIYSVNSVVLDRLTF